ncbi:LysE family translocator [Deinococcus cavernae]|uniref:LysE family translocator n=1 Tax=Deinococcus cavernae TaxID=2320857 RepID=UPI00131465DE|nr:LysE family translocator [Deinococcus cavernae]
MTLTTLAALVAFLLPLQVSPGPANVYFAVLGARGGVRRAVPALLGYLCGVVIMTLLLGFALDAKVFRPPGLMAGMSVAGGLYLSYLGGQMLSSPGAPGSEVGLAGDFQAHGGALQGALVLLLNPKAYLIVGLTLAQFAAGQAVTLPYVLAVTGAICATFTVAFVLWANLGAGSKALPARWAHRLNVVCAVGVLVMGLWMTWEGVRGWLD